MALTLNGPTNTPTGVTYVAWRGRQLLGTIDRDTDAGAFRYTVQRPATPVFDPTNPRMIPVGEYLTLTNAIQALDLLKED